MLPKKLLPGSSSTSKHSEPLDVQIKRDAQVIPLKKTDGTLNPKLRKKNRIQLAPVLKHEPNKEEEEDQFIDEDPIDLIPGKISKRLHSQVLNQQEELQFEDNSSSFGSIKEDDSDDIGIEDDDSKDALLEELDALYVDSNVDSSGHFNQSDRELFEKWIRPASTTETRTLAEMILQKLQETKENLNLNAPISSNTNPLPEKVVEVYQKLGLLLTRYKSGKLPKAFKVLPALSNWQDVLAVASPESWTPHSVYQATKLFASSLKPLQAQLFYESVLLPHVRTNIAEQKKLNVYLYDALKKAIYKPSAFYKGIILPLCTSGDCTLREAVIVSSVLSKQSIPVLHSAACLLKLSELEYSACISIFIRTLLDKKYTLPKRVVSALVCHFTALKDDLRPCYLLWHQSLLVFIQR